MRSFHPLFRAFTVTAVGLAPAGVANANNNIGADAVRTTGITQVFAPKGEQPRAACAALGGEWHNVDPATRSITHIELSTDCAAGTATIQVWGACHPRDCKWRPFSGTYDRKKQAIIGRSTASFKIAGLAIKADAQGHVVVTTFSHFTDNSGRKDYTVVDTMER